MASSSSGTPGPGGYWLRPPSMAALAASSIAAGPSVSGKPWPRLIAAGARRERRHLGEDRRAEAAHPWHEHRPSWTVGRDGLLGHPSGRGCCAATDRAVVDDHVDRVVGLEVERRAGDVVVTGEISLGEDPDGLDVDVDRVDDAVDVAVVVDVVERATRAPTWLAFRSMARTSVPCVASFISMARTYSCVTPAPTRNGPQCCEICVFFRPAGPLGGRRMGRRPRSTRSTAPPGRDGRIGRGPGMTDAIHPLDERARARRHVDPRADRRAGAAPGAHRS